jgi:hypothetical protein
MTPPGRRVSESLTSAATATWDFGDVLKGHAEPYERNERNGGGGGGGASCPSPNAARGRARDRAPVDELRRRRPLRGRRRGERRARHTSRRSTRVVVVSGEAAVAVGREGTFYTLVPIRPRRRGERRSLRTFAVVSLRPHLAFNPRPRRISTSTDAFQLHPDVRSYGTTQRRAATWASSSLEVRRETTTTTTTGVLRTR